MARCTLLFWILLIGADLSAQIQSPEEFLGYKLGSKFTPHWKLVEYFKYVGQQVPGNIKVEQYGSTNEGRPLILAYIASSANFRNLEAIRQNNLRLASLLPDRMAPSETGPVVVWLSYNVHGNEASSSEASMLTLYTLADPFNERAKEWLKNTVIIMDPCLNPDGRDRYVNWFTSVVGMNVNVDPQAREHREPWPGGRTNHYNFDLNRDWAWQSQVETQQRLAKYNQWLPQVHVDFHEQSYNNPYYFAPAALPYHEVVTPWQRDFQLMIGKNNAKYFDQNGWLYFTKGGGYDLFYPSYGDTYPTYHGAVGMTFEQGGGGGGGLGVINQDGDTLTLKDRLTHHFTTALSTIEVSSQNAVRLLKEFRKFYNDGITNGVGEYKTYLVKRKSTGPALESLLKRYLSNNGITWGVANSTGTYRGFNYLTGKEGNISVEKQDILLTSYQPNSAMLKVLFEPRSKQEQVRSRPYDITAWSLPYALGLEAYAIKVKVNQGPDQPVTKTDSSRDKTKLRSAYAYLLPWKDLSSAKVLARLLQSGVKARYQDLPFSINGKDFDPGTLIITRASNSKFGDALYDTVIQASRATDFDYPVEPVYTGFVDKGKDFGSSNVRLVKVPKCALLTGEETDATAVGAIWHFLDRQLHYPVTLINSVDMPRIDLSQYNVIIMPACNRYRFLEDKGLNDQLKLWVRNGGKIIAMEGAVDELAKADWGLKNKSETGKKKETDEQKDTAELIKRFNNRELENLATINTGTIYKVELDNSHPLAFGYPEFYFTLKQDDAVYEFIKEGGWNVGILKNDNYISGFLGTRAQEKLKDGLLFAVQDMGRGSVVYLADDLLFRSFWENGKLMFCNAVFLVGQ